MLWQSYGQRAVDDPALPCSQAELALAYREGWLDMNIVSKPDADMCRAAVYQSIFAAENVQIYPYEFYEEGIALSAPENYIRVGHENGLCGENVDPYDRATKKENYIQYIASRPRAQRIGTHALFTGSDESLTLSQVAETVARHPGNVWLPILSLRREDAARLGYDDTGRWKDLLTGYAMEMAKAMKIPWEQFRWYAAFHDEGHHPHIHMVCYSADGKSGYLTKEGIAQIKSDLAKEIFRNELTELYQKQTQRRDDLTQQAGQVMHELVRQMEYGTLENPHIEQLMEHLSGKLKNLSGKKQYGYLKAPLKAVVDEIVDELSKDPRIAQAYGLWYDLREEVLRTYKNDLPERLPLSQQKEFKPIKNMIIREAVRLGELRQVFHPEDQTEDILPEQEGADAPQPGPQSVWNERTHDSGEPRASWERAYWNARAILNDPNAAPKHTARAVELLIKAAEHGNCSAAFALGKLYLSGTSLPRDPIPAIRWLERAALGGNQHVQYRLGKLLLQGEDVPKDTDRAIRWLTASAEQGNKYAQYALGKLYLLGQDVPQDRDAALKWFSQYAAQGNQYAQYFQDHINEFQSPPLAASVIRLLHHLADIFREQEPRLSVGPIRFTDKKLRRKIQAKKIAMGHKPDDHEEPTITM